MLSQNEHFTVMYFTGKWIFFCVTSDKAFSTVSKTSHLKYDDLYKFIKLTCKPRNPHCWWLQSTALSSLLSPVYELKTETQKGREGRGGNHKRLKTARNHLEVEHTHTAPHPLPELTWNLWHLKEVHHVGKASGNNDNDIWSHSVQNTSCCPLSMLNTASRVFDAVCKSPCATETWSIFNK